MVCAACQAECNSQSQLLVIYNWGFHSGFQGKWFEIT